MVWTVSECAECDRPAAKRTLCLKHYQAHYRAGDLWLFPDLRMLDDVTKIEAMIEWVYQFYYDRLVIGFQEYVEGQWEIVDDGRGLSLTKTGSTGYAVNGVPMGGEKLCNECMDSTSIHARGLCEMCYDMIRSEDRLEDYPTQDFVKNPDGYIYWALNNHLNRVINIGVEYGLDIHRLP